MDKKANAKSPKTSPGKSHGRRKKGKPWDVVSAHSRWKGYLRTRGKLPTFLPIVVHIVLVSVNKKTKAKEFRGRLYWTGRWGLRGPAAATNAQLRDSMAAALNLFVSTDTSISDFDDPINDASIRIEGTVTEETVVTFTEVTNGPGGVVCPIAAAALATAKDGERAGQGQGPGPKKEETRKPYVFEGELSEKQIIGNFMGEVRGTFELNREDNVICFDDLEPPHVPVCGGTTVTLSCIGFLSPDSGPVPDLPDQDRIRVRLHPEGPEGGTPSMLEGSFSVFPRKDPFPKDSKEAMHIWKVKFRVPEGTYPPGYARVEVGFIPQGIEPIEITEPFLVDSFSREPGCKYRQISKRKLLLTLNDSLEAAKDNTDLYALKEKIKKYAGPPEIEMIIVRDFMKVYGKSYFLCSTQASFQSEIKRLAQDESAVRPSPFVALQRKLFFYPLPNTTLKISPIEGPVSGGTVVTISGSHFLNTAYIIVEAFDGSNRKTVPGRFKSDMELTFVTPRNDYDGTVAISLSLNKQNFVSVPQLFRYVEPCQWMTVDSDSEMAPSARFSALAAVVCRRLYLFGGNDSKHALADFFVYDFADKQWMAVSTTGAYPHARQECVAGSLGHLIFLFGAGFASPIGSTDTVYVLDTNTRKWDELKTYGGVNPPTCIGCVCLSSPQRRMMLVGGRDVKSQLSIFDPESMTWLQPQVTGDLPKPRVGHTVTLVLHRVFLFGGQLEGSNTFTNDLYVLDLDEMRWKLTSAHGDAPPPRAGHSAGRIGHRLYIFGGQNRTGCLNDLYSLDLKQMLWLEVHPSTEECPGPRFGSALASLGSSLLLFGGSNGRVPLREFYELQVEQCLRALKESHGVTQVFMTGTAPSPRAGHTATIVGRCVYVFGGYYDVWNTLNDIYKFNLDSYDWWKLTPEGAVPPPRWAHTASIVGRKLYVIGGSGISQKGFNDVWILDIDQNCWTSAATIGDPPPPLYGHCAVVLGTRIIIYGGGHGTKRLNDIYEFDTNSLQWARLGYNGTPPDAAQFHSGSLLNNKLWVFGGTSKKDTYSNTLHTLDFGSMTWERVDVKGAPSARMGHSCSVVGKKLMIWGGYGEQNACSDLNIYDTEAKTWTRRCKKMMGSMVPRYWHATISTDMMLVIFGGQCSAWKFFTDVYTICCCFACL